MRWVGIDEAGYGPNLGPMVMTAVVAEGPDATPPDLWRDLAATVARAGCPSGRLWVDDSKAILRGRSGRDRLEAASLATLAASGAAPPCSFGGMLAALGAGTFADVELSPWLDADDLEIPRPSTRGLLERAANPRPFDGAPWRIVAVRSVVVGPARFNAELAATGSKAKVHFAAFARLLAPPLGLRRRWRPHDRPVRQARRPPLLPRPAPGGLPRLLDRPRRRGPGAEPVHDPRAPAVASN